jgi:hypothetical protein
VYRYYKLFEKKHKPDSQSSLEGDREKLAPGAIKDAVASDVGHLLLSS